MATWTNATVSVSGTAGGAFMGFLSAVTTAGSTSSTSWTNVTKNSATFTNVTKNAATFTNVTKS